MDPVVLGGDCIESGEGAEEEERGARGVWEGGADGREAEEEGQSITEEGATEATEKDAESVTQGGTAAILILVGSRAAQRRWWTLVGGRCVDPVKYRGRQSLPAAQGIASPSLPCRIVTLDDDQKKSNQILSLSGTLFISIGIYFFLHPLSDIQIFRCRYWKPQHLATSGALEPLFWYRREERNSLPFYQFHLTWSWLSRESELLGIGGLTDWNRILWRSRASFGMPHVIFTRKCVAHSLCVT